MDSILSCISENNLWLAVIALCLIVADIISGIMKGYATKTLSSEKMRTGFWHKSANVFLLFLAYSATVANGFIEGMPEWTQSVYVFASGYIAVMELTSILENLAEINPQLKSAVIFERFGLKQEPKEEEKDE